MPPAFMLVSCLAYSSTLKVELICFSEMLVDFQQTTQRYIPNDRILHNHHCENLKSYFIWFVLSVFTLRAVFMFCHHLLALFPFYMGQWM
jgi:hypothetical protein